jgi:hypothetical protein
MKGNERVSHWAIAGDKSKSADLPDTATGNSKQYGQRRTAVGHYKSDTGCREEIFLSATKYRRGSALSTKGPVEKLQRTICCSGEVTISIENY